MNNLPSQEKFELQILIIDGMADRIKENIKTITADYEWIKQVTDTMTLESYAEKVAHEARKILWGQARRPFGYRANNNEEMIAVFYAGLVLMKQLTID